MKSKLASTAAENTNNRKRVRELTQINEKLETENADLKKRNATQEELLESYLKRTKVLEDQTNRAAERQTASDTQPVAEALSTPEEASTTDREVNREATVNTTLCESIKSANMPRKADADSTHTSALTSTRYRKNTPGVEPAHRSCAGITTANVDAARRTANSFI